ncbi:transposase [Actinocorallia populi]|uniref:transposase n=1 Tax=Actinocorallia populi TaxID=2079200 RepID=UPI0038BA4FEA
MRRALTLEEREEIAVGRERGEGVREIARRIGRVPSVVSREIRRNSSTGCYRVFTAHRRAVERGRRSQQRRLDGELVLRERVLADLRYGRTPNQIAGRLKLEAADGTVALTEGSLPAGRGHDLARSRLHLDLRAAQGRTGPPGRDAARLPYRERPPTQARRLQGRPDRRDAFDPRPSRRSTRPPGPRPLGRRPCDTMPHGRLPSARARPGPRPRRAAD